MIGYLISVGILYYLYSFTTKSSPSSMGSEDKLIENLVHKGIDYRIEKRDGQSYPLTMDYVPDRANLTIQNGKVIKIRYG
tara:strand:+ start:1949 stop:2188 length:240 start_codon:yes stop_codon:yes gene_type:complete